MFELADAVDDDAELGLPVFAVVAAVPDATELVDMCVAVCAVPETGPCETCPLEAPWPEAVEFDDATVVLEEVASAAEERPVVSVGSAVLVGVASE